MRRIIAAACLAVLVPIAASAQTDEPPTANTETRHPIADSIARTQMPLYQAPHIRSFRSLNATGAAVGAAIGAGLGWWFVASACEGDCATSYVAAMGLFGALGAGIGAALPTSHRQRPASPFGSRVDVAPIVTPTVHAGAVSVWF